MTNESYFTIEEVAIRLRVVYLTVYRWIVSGRLKAVRAGRQYRIAKSDLHDFISYKNKDKNEKHRNTR